MPDPLTTNLQLSQPTNGSDVGTWDQPMNGNTGILDACFGSVTTVALTNNSVFLTVQQAQVCIIRLTGTLTASPHLHIPLIGTWTFDNQCVGGSLNFTVYLTGAVGNVSGIPPGVSRMFYDGSNSGWINLGSIVGGIVNSTISAVPEWVAASDVPPYLVSNGSSYDPAKYPLLFDVLGTTTLPNISPNPTGGVVFIRAL